MEWFWVIHPGTNILQHNAVGLSGGPNVPKWRDIAPWGPHNAPQGHFGHQTETTGIPHPQPLLSSVTPMGKIAATSATLLE